MRCIRSRVRIFMKMDNILYFGEKEHIRFNSAKGIHYPSVKAALSFADTQGWQKIGVAYSGVYFDRREDGWYKTSDFDACDRVHGLPSNGLKIT